MKIRNFLHKGLKRLYEEGSSRGVPASAADKLRKMIAYLEAIDDAGELRLVPGWKAHTLTGERKGTWSLSVTKNWRLTFRVNAAEREICDVNFEDYH